MEKKVVVMIGLVTYTAISYCDNNTERHLSMLFIAFATVYVANRSSAGLYFTKYFGDLSDGFYIYAFPVQQAIIYYYKDKEYNFYIYLCMSITITAVMAAASWNFVEVKFLRLKSLTIKNHTVTQ